MRLGLPPSQRRLVFLYFAAACFATAGNVSIAEEPRALTAVLARGPARAAGGVLTDPLWRDLDRAVDRGLAFLAARQLNDGSFESRDYAQPAVTSLCVMAFLSRGHAPGEGPYGDQLASAIDFVLAVQQPSGLLFAYVGSPKYWSLGGCYNHAIAGVMLGEVYGMTSAAQQERVRGAIERALEFTRREQEKPKRWTADRGGWRYLRPKDDIDSDLSVTSWQLMFYRSARNAGFDVPEDSVAAAVEYVTRTFDERRGSFAYGLRGEARMSFSRGMAGAGILSLSLAGQHHSEMAQRAGDFLLQHDFNEFNGGGITFRDRYYYAAYYCSQAMFQLGGRHWNEFYPEFLQTFVENQRRDGSWEREAFPKEGELGLTYSTALAVLSLTPPYQLLPIYQR